MSQRILVVEDQEDNRKILRDLLHERRFRGHRSRRWRVGACGSSGASAGKTLGIDIPWSLQQRADEVIGSCPGTWCNNGAAVMITGGAGSIKLLPRLAA